MSQEQQKQLAAQAALQYVEQGTVIGVGTGSTVKYFIEALATIKAKIESAVASSNATAGLLKAHGIPVCDLNSVNGLSLYVDGADEANEHLQLIKGGGAALTREKILAATAEQFICIADQSKLVPLLGQKAPLPIEVIPMARSYVARMLVKMGGFPEYRVGVVTDNGNAILDVYHLDFVDPVKLEQQINNIAGVVCNGLFAQRRADLLILSTDAGTKTLR